MSENNLCALVIGHKKDSPGASNAEKGMTEFVFNDDLAKRIEGLVKKAKVKIVYRKSYSGLPADINALDPGFIVSLHCNAFNKEATGTEVLYYHLSKNGEKIAEILLKRLVGHLQLKDRKIRPKKTEDRGGYLLRYTNAPCVIAEPFFIDNDTDLATAQADMDGLAQAYAEAIDEMVGVLA
jgi:N-acetylmuramoyl-L-alanine amidase